MNKEFLERLEKIEKALDAAISMDFSDQWKSASFGKLPEAVKPLFIQNLIEPNKKLINLGGKRWRPLFLILCYELASEKNKEHFTEEQAYGLTPLVEFVHTASLIHDDIEDSADTRRGKPAAHITYGLDTALNAASWLYFEAAACINTLNLSQAQQLELYNLYSRELRRLHLGQAMDIYWHRNKDIFPAMDEYKAMVKNKTGTLSSLAAQIGFMAGGECQENQFKAGDIASNLGIGFQIIDDVQNLTFGNPGKKRGDDIVEGKKSLPVLIHIERKPQDKAAISELMAQAEKEGIDSPAVEECIQLLKTSGCIEEAAEQGKNIIKENCQIFASFYGQAENKDKESSAAKLITALFDSMIPENYR